MVTFDKPQAENTQNTQTFSSGNPRFANIYRQNVAAYKNMLMTLPNMTENERDWAYSYDMWKFMSDNVNDIYRGVEDPREALSDEVVGTMIHNLYPNISKENAVKNARSIVKGMTGDDMSSSNVIEVAFEKVKNGFASLGAGFQNLRYIFEHGESDDPEINAQRLKDQQAMLNAKIGNLKRTDYYNKDFDSFIDKMVLAAADFIPSEIASFVPTAVGGALSALTGNPLFFSLGSVISGGLAGVMEAGSTSVELAQAGAPISSQMGFSTIVGLANGTLEWLGNVAERGTVESIFNLKKLYKEVGDNQIAKMTARDFGRHLATEYAINLVSEPTTEGLQELTSMFVMNLASEWQKKNVGKSFSEEFTYSPQEMAKNVFDTVKETFRGQMLIGLGGGVMDTVSNLTYHLDTSNGIRNWKWEAGQLKQALDANKYGKASANSIFVDNKNVVINENAKTYEPTYTTDNKGNQKADQVSPVKAVKINNKLVPINSDEMAKAKYLAENSKYGMYVEITDNESVGAEAVTKLEAQTIINSLLPDEIGGHAVDYMYKENGDIAIGNKADMDAIIMALAQNAKNIRNIHPTEDGYKITLGDKEVTLTTSTEGGMEFNQSDYMRQAVDEIRNQAKEEIDNDWNKRIEDIQERSERMKATERRIKESNFRAEINKVIDSMITDKVQRKEEKKKITEAVNRIAKEAEKAFSSASENSTTFKNILGDTDVSTASKSFARGTVMAVSKLAQSMGMNTSEFLDKINFKYSVESMKGGKERAGWTEVHSDGTFDINVTSFLDQSTGIHEMGHAYLSMLGDNYKAIEGFEDVFKKELEQDKGKVGRNTQEAFAEALEAYVNEGLAKSEGLRKVFDLILDALRNFINSVKELLSPEKVAMFDNLFEKGLKDFNAEDTTYNEDTFFAKDADDYVNDYNYNSERAYEALKNNDSELTERLKGITDVFSNGVLDYIKDEYGDGVDIVKIDENNAEADFLDGSDAADLVYKFLNDPMAMTYNDTFETDVTILLPSGDGLTVAIMARTDTQDFRNWRENYIREQLLHKAETEEEKVNTRRTFLSNMFEEIERDNYGNVERISYAGGASRYKGPEHNQSTKYINTGEEAQVFGWGLYESAVRAIAKHYADHVSKSKGFGIDDVKYTVSKFLRDYFSAFATKGPAAMRKTNFNGYAYDVQNINGTMSTISDLGDVYRQIIEKNYQSIMENGMQITKDDVLAELDSIISEVENTASEESLAEIRKVRDDIAYDKINLKTKPVTIDKKPDTVAKTIHTNIISGDDSKFIPWEGEIPHMVIEDIIEHVAAEMDRTGKGYYLDALYDYISSFDEKTGEDLYHALSAVMWNVDKEASRILKEMGYEGIKYMADSRGGHYNEGYNYVIFDDAFVKSIREEEMDEQGNIVADRKWNKDVSPIYFKDADLDMSEDEVADRLGKGLFVPNEVLDKYPDHPFVKLERLVQNIVGTKPEWFKLYKRSVDEYLKETGLSLEDFDKWNYRQILNDWNKRLKGANEYMEIPVDTNGDYIYFLRRLNAYANMESPERAETAWMDKLNHTRNGRDNIRNLALEMDKLGLFDDKLEGYDLSARFSALNMIANKTSGSEKRGTRPRIDVSVYDQALDEAFRNRDYIRSQLNDENTNTYESNMKDMDSETNYMESEEILNILKDKDVSPEIKNIIKNGVFTGTVVRDLMKDANERLRKLRSQNRTIDLVNREIEVLRGRTNLYEKEIEDLENGISHKNMAQMVKLREKLAEAKEELRNLAKEKGALADRLATEVLAGALYKTKRQVQDIVKSNSGEADVNRALRETVNEVINYYRKKARNPEIEVTVRLNEMKYRLDEDGQPMKDAEGNTIPGKAPELARFLEDNDMVDENGKLIKGFEDLNVAQLKAFRKAVKTDKENTKSRQKENQRIFEANVQSLAGRVVSTMKPKKLEKTLSADDRKEINEEVKKRTEGRFVSDAERRQIESDVLGEFLSSKIQEIADGAVYGIESHTEAVNKKKNILDDFTTLSRLLRHISPELEKFVMNGLNKMTDAKYRNTDSRMKTFFNNIKEMYKLKNDKELQKFLNTFVTDRRDIGRAAEEGLPERLQKNKLFMEMWEADEKSGKNSQVHKFQFSIQDLMAIEEQSLEWDGLRHLNKGCGLSAAEIAWTVNQFESEGGSLEKYKPAADEIRRVYGERFQQIYDTVLSAENREMLKVSFYSPMFGVGLDKDLTMKFSDVFSDDRKAQANWFTKDREFGTNAIDINYYSRLQKVVEMQEAYINGAEFYRQLDHLFNEKGGNLRNIITEVYGSPAFKRIETMLDLTKTDAVRNIITEADNMASTIRNHYVMARLAYNMSSVFQQVGSWFLGLSKYGLVDLWKASMQFIAHPITMSNRVYELSPQMKHAVNPLIRMAYETAKPNPTTVLGKVDKFVSSIGEKGLVLMEKQDHIIRNILWWTAYQKEVANAQEQIANVNNSTSLTDEQKNGKVNEIMEQAQRNATQWVLDIQSSSQVKDNSLMYSGGNLFWKQVLMFTNQLNKEWNMLYVDGIKEGLFQKQYGKFFANMAALGLSTMFIVAITGKIKNDEDDDETWAEDLMKDWGIEFASRVPLVGNTVKNVYEGFAYKQSDDVVSRLTQLIAKLANEKADTKQKMTALRNFGWSGLDLFGAPTTAAKRIYQAFEDGRIYEADHFMRLLGGEWYKYFEE